MPAVHAVQRKRDLKPSARIEARVEPEQKQLFKRAAQVEGVSLTDFAISSMQRAATQTLQAHRLIVLSERDQQAFLKAVMNPPEPNEALRRAANRYAGMNKTR